MEESLIASNTFREGEITWYGYRTGAREAGKVLDSVQVSRGTVFAPASVSWPRELGSTRRFSDHALVRTELQLDRPVVAPRYVARAV
eukprot:3295479-Pyramimonas_sp.AAC.1